MAKITSVSDSIHESIPISPIEKSILSTTIFNRLHNVLQTSTVYLTFPSSRHSRFSHSLGVMHLAGRIYRNSVINSPKSVVNKFLDALLEEIREVENDPEVFWRYFPLTIQDLESRQSQESFEDLEEAAFSHPFYHEVAPSHIVSLSEESITRYNLVMAGYQAARLAGLLHDVGHPPFSHVAEFALTDIYDEFEGKSAAQEGSVRACVQSRGGGCNRLSIKCVIAHKIIARLDSGVPS